MSWMPREENVSTKRQQATILSGAERLRAQRVLDLTTWLSEVTLATEVSKWWEWMPFGVHRGENSR